ncbi:MAG TPA: DUF4870 domain-containing protein [Intrasporangium sp.]|uniref:DUF4870 domain-containing protein n=1 Tax=Intrasporangium sp. TaxID=1925024 RepID=UPI002D7916AC|nr:DUF4870 domain-containing protein [Intrasporangium sp.]HET7399989.1 DUF4870 domain-containing protein [Intrasporangium sp.]
MTHDDHYRPDPTRDAARGVALSSDDERTWAMLAHGSALVAAIVSAGWLSFVGPLLVWALYKDRSAFVRRSAAGAFNFNIVLWVLSIVGWVFFITLIGIPIALILWVIVFVASILFHLVGAMRAYRGEEYRYPWGITVLR